MYRYPIKRATEVYTKIEKEEIDFGIDFHQPTKQFKINYIWQDKSI
jgi:hypothetical protein